MGHLDCETTATAYMSLETILGIDEHKMRAAFDALDLDRYYQENPHTSLMPTEVVLEHLNCHNRLSAIKLDGVCWFHLTRVSDRTEFLRRGVLPLDLVLESIWDFLYTLTRPRMSASSWAAFREGLITHPHHSAYLYRLKVAAPLHWGPYAMLMREVAFVSDSMHNHDYLRTPEIVEDICSCFQNDHGADLLAAYSAATSPCIVKFLIREMEPRRREECVTAALFHLYRRHRGEDLSLECNTCWDNKGQPIPAASIMKVECV